MAALITDYAHGHRPTIARSKTVNHENHQPLVGHKNRGHAGRFVRTFSAALNYHYAPAKHRTTAVIFHLFCRHINIDKKKPPVGF